MSQVMRLAALAAATALVLGAAIGPSVASPMGPKSCKKAGATATLSGQSVVCVKTPRGLVWKRQKPGSGGSTAAGATSAVTWVPTADGRRANGTPPACPVPLALTPPADLAKVTSVLYPGQTRGGNYKPHGGFRFDANTSNQVTVKVPMSGSVVQGAAYLEDGEVQYTFDIMSPCGIMNRLGHLLVLSPKFQAIADKFPAAVEGDSRTTFVSPPVQVKAGEVMATEVGFTAKGRNVFFDWGVYDYRAKNAISSNAQWAAQHAGYLALAGHAVCWFNLLSTSDEVRVKSLPPSDPTSGKSSDYC